MMMMMIPTSSFLSGKLLSSADCGSSGVTSSGDDGANTDCAALYPIAGDNDNDDIDDDYGSNDCNGDSDNSNDDSNDNDDDCCYT